MSMAFFSGGHSTQRKRPLPATDTSSSTRSRCAIGSRPPTLKTCPLRRVVGTRAKERVRGVVHEHEVAELRAVAVDLDLPVLQGQTDEPGDESLTVVLDQLARTVDVGQAQRAGAHAEHVVVHEMVVLARRLVDAVHVGWLHQVLLGDGQAVSGRPYTCRVPAKTTFTLGL